MYFNPRPLFLLLTLTSPLTTAQHILEGVSFGHRLPLSPGGFQIPGWQHTAEQHSLQFLSDRVSLTPPSPGHARGALWTEQAITTPSWNAEVSFRASGPERGSGNLQIWYTRVPAPALGLSSVYTVGEFDGLVLVVDQYGGRGGMIRGFLNDGAVNFKNHHSVDSLAFGNCDYAYRNRGEYTKLKIRVDEGVGLEVEVDGRRCFGSDQIQLPSGYHFGISAASSETPDSFEVSQFVVSSSGALARDDPSAHLAPYDRMQPPPQQHQSQNQEQQQQQQQHRPPSFSGGAHIDSQLHDLQNRFDSLSSLTETLLGEVRALSDRLYDMQAALPASTGATSQQVDNLDGKVRGIARTVERIQSDVEGRDYRESLTGLERALRETQEGLVKGLPEGVAKIVTTSAPRTWFIVAVLVSVQIALAASYVVYKRRRANSPKKLL